MFRFAVALVTITWLTSRSYCHADVFGTGENQLEIEFVTIGNPGNPPDTTGSPNPAGAVDYVYRIGKYEISREMIEKANAAGGLGLTLGLDFVTGVLGDGPRPDMPATVISWNEAARFINWLNTSEGYSPAYKFASQPGDPGYNAEANIELWQTGDTGYDANNLFRNRQAHYFLPTVHEWYKAAYYDPNANDGAGGYWNFPTGGDSGPTAVASGTAAGTTVRDQPFEQGPADITQAGGLSSYGTMAQGGNVWEWEETEWDLVNDAGSSFRGLRGGAWSCKGCFSDSQSASDRERTYPSGEGFFVGFRVASAAELSLVGDFNGNGVLDAADIDLLIPGEATDPSFDLNGDSIIDQADRGTWVRDLASTFYGDANLDGEFNSGDLITALAAGTYEADIDAGWASGDFDGDGRFDTSDLIFALADGGYEAGPRVAVSVVPEPASMAMFFAGLVGLAIRRR